MEVWVLLLSQVSVSRVWGVVRPVWRTGTTTCLCPYRPSCGDKPGVHTRIDSSVLDEDILSTLINSLLLFCCKFYMYLFTRLNDQFGDFSNLRCYVNIYGKQIIFPISISIFNTDLCEF